MSESDGVSFYKTNTAKFIPFGWLIFFLMANRNIVANHNDGVIHLFDTTNRISVFLAFVPFLSNIMLRVESELMFVVLPERFTQQWLSQNHDLL